MPVSVNPGATALTRIPSGAHLDASVCVSCASADLLTAYAAIPAAGHVDGR